MAPNSELISSSKTDILAFRSDTTGLEGISVFGAPGDW